MSNLLAFQVEQISAFSLKTNSLETEIQKSVVAGVRFPSIRALAYFFYEYIACIIVM